MAHILVIEDDVTFQEMLVQMLETDGHQVARAGDGVEAMALLERIRPELILTDILMPNMDGVETIVALSAQCTNIPVIAMSGGWRSITPEFNLSTAVLLGAKATLTKPFSRADLRQAIAEALSGN